MRLILLIVTLLWITTARPVTAQYARALPGYSFRFPRDHGAHENFRTEWWYFTGNLNDPQGREFGYELTFFRNSLLPQGDQVARKSPLVARQVYLAHFAISDMGAKEHQSWEQIGRDGLDQGSASPVGLDVRLGSWHAIMDPQGMIMLRADAKGGRLELTLKPDKPLVIHGERGVHQKADDPGQASHYISFTRLETSGKIWRDGKEFAVTGLTWMDHEFGSDQLSIAEVGWDWFALQLDRGDDLMLYQLRRKDGSYNPHSAGTHVAPNGKASRLPSTQYTITINKYWTSPHSKARYPMDWTIRIPGQDAELHVTPAFEDQEMLTTRYTGEIYWEGAIRVAGRWRGKPVKGKGYVELVGYAEHHRRL